jgi:hypothetical protein
MGYTPNASPEDQQVIAQLSADWQAYWDDCLRVARKPSLIDAVRAFLAREIARRGVAADDKASAARLLDLLFVAIRHAGTHTPEAVWKTHAALTRHGMRRWLQRFQPAASTSPPAQRTRPRSPQPPRRRLRRRFERVAFLIAIAFGIAAALGFAGAGHCLQYGECRRWSSGWWFTHGAPLSVLALVVAFAYDATFGKLVAWVRRGE